MSVGVLAAFAAFGVWLVAYAAGRRKTRLEQYARGWMDGYNAQDEAYVEAQRENAPWQ